MLGAPAGERNLRSVARRAHGHARAERIVPRLEVWAPNMDL